MANTNKKAVKTSKKGREDKLKRPWKTIPRNGD